MPKAKPAELDTDASVDGVYDFIEKDFGEGIIVSGGTALDVKRGVVPIGPALDIITSGGIQEGSVVGVTGNEKTGKTTFALSLAANAQRPEYGGRKVFFADIEHRLVESRLKEISGLKYDRPWFNLIRSAKGKILCAEQHLDIMYRVLKQMENVVLIIDSISAMCEEKIFTEGVGTQTRGSGAKLFSQWLSMVSSVIPVNNHIVIGITHLISNTSGMGAMYMEKAARRWKYAYDYHLRTITTEAWLAGDKEIGKKVKWKCSCSKLGPPGMQIESYLRYSAGIDRLFELLSFAKPAGLITGKGWYTLDYLASEQNKHLLNGDPPPKVQGDEKVYKLLLANPEWAAALNRDLMSLMVGLPASNDD